MERFSACTVLGSAVIRLPQLRASAAAAAEMAAVVERASKLPVQSLGGAWPCYRHIRLAAWAFECRVDDSEIGQFEQSPGDHFEGQFEGQNGASERSSEPVPAGVS